MMEEFLPVIWEISIRIFQFLLPVCVAFLFGLVVGWAWKPRWTNSVNGNFKLSVPSSVASSLVPHPVLGSYSTQNLDSVQAITPSLSPCLMDEGVTKEKLHSPETENSACDCGKECRPIITEHDLEHLCLLVERRDGGPPWKHMFERSAESMSYEAWQRDMENGPPQYCSRTVYEDATPQLLRDFFWDDEFRLKWDDMFSHGDILEECSANGTMVVQWIRKFPFFCSDREYIIGRRIWDSGRSYYCLNKGVLYSSLPKKDKPRRVDAFYSSWFIQEVESRKRTGSTACEVILFHYEDMGIPWEIMKFGVRHGMWGAVKNIERGFRAYQKHRLSSEAISHHAIMASINTKIDPSYLNILEGDQNPSETELIPSADEKTKDLNIPKLLIVIGGAVAVACTLDRGMLAKALVFDVARRFGNLGRRGTPGTL